MSGRQSVQVDALVGQFSSNQIEFLAEEELVTVVPNFTPRHSQYIRCLGGKFGPCRAGLAMDVPLWMGLLMKKSRSCRFQPPDWLNPDTLADWLRTERSEQFLPLPFHYIEIGNLLLTYANDDIPEADSVRKLLLDLVEVRSNKIREVLKHLDPSSSVLILKGMSAMELNRIRLVCLRALDLYGRMSSVENPELDEDQLDGGGGGGGYQGSGRAAPAASSELQIDVVGAPPARQQQQQQNQARALQRPLEAEMDDLKVAEDLDDDFDARIPPEDEMFLVDADLEDVDGGDEHQLGPGARKLRRYPRAGPETQDFLDE